MEVRGRVSKRNQSSNGVHDWLTGGYGVYDWLTVYCFRVSLQSPLGAWQGLFSSLLAPILQVKFASTVKFKYINTFFLCLIGTVDETTLHHPYHDLNILTYSEPEPL